MAYGANVNAKNNFGTTPLMMASNRSHGGIVERLLCNGANIGDEDNNGEKAVFQTDRKDIARIIERWPLTMVISILQELTIHGCVNFDFYKDLQEFGLHEKRPPIIEELAELEEDDP
jgi:hypothetical protein